jgi:hypothetical protein
MILRFVLAADVATVALACLVFAAFGWVLGYAHRELVAWGVTRARLLAWRRKHRRRDWRGVWS